MYLKKIIIYGFKSFANKTEIELQKRNYWNNWAKWFRKK